MLIALSILSFFLVLPIFNRFIGDAGWKISLRKLLPGDFLYTRVGVYIVTGLMAANLSFLCGHSVYQAVVSFFCAIILYVVYRQPSPNEAFYAGTDGRYYPEGGIAWLNALVRKIHGFRSHVLMVNSERKRWGRVWGAYRGAFIGVGGVCFGTFLNPLAPIFCLPGLLFGLIHSFVGVDGPLKTEERVRLLGINLPSMRGRAELVEGLTILPIAIIGPILTTGYFSPLIERGDFVYLISAMAGVIDGIR